MRNVYKSWPVLLLMCRYYLGTAIFTLHDMTYLMVVVVI